MELNAHRVADVFDNIAKIATVVLSEHDRILIGRLVDSGLNSVFGALWDGFGCGHGYNTWSSTVFGTILAPASGVMLISTPCFRLG